ERVRRAVAEAGWASMTSRMALRLAGDLLVGVHSGGVRTDRTMYGPVAGRRPAGLARALVGARRRPHRHPAVPSGFSRTNPPVEDGRNCRQGCDRVLIARRRDAAEALR